MNDCSDYRDDIATLIGNLYGIPPKILLEKSKEFDMFKEMWDSHIQNTFNNKEVNKNE